MKKITILLPAYNEASSIQLLHDKMLQVLQENPGYEWEFLIVNDGSTDDTLRLIKKLHSDDPRFSYIDLSRNYGKEIAMMAGFDYASGDAVIIMDSDMQHPVLILPEMIRYWKEGWQDVYAQRKSSKESWFKRKTSEFYYNSLFVDWVCLPHLHPCKHFDLRRSRRWLPDGNGDGVVHQRCAVALAGYNRRISWGVQ